MHTTSISLLERLKLPAAQESWKRFVDLYTPLLFYWARRLGLQEADAADLVQDVCALLVKKLHGRCEDAVQRQGRTPAGSVRSRFLGLRSGHYVRRPKFIAVQALSLIN